MDPLGDLLGTGLVFVSLYSVLLGSTFRPHVCTHRPDKRDVKYTDAEAQVHMDLLILQQCCYMCCCRMLLLSALLGASTSPM